jgi:hypothetical protein
MTLYKHIFRICYVYTNNMLRALLTNSIILMAFK